MSIKLLVMDVDGTLTDGRIYMGQDGEAMKAFDVKDGYGIAHILPRIGVTPVIITGRRSRIVENRARELGIKELHQGVGDKLAAFREVAGRFGADADEIAYVGDDENDLECMRYAGTAVAPADASDEAKAAADIVCAHEGGRGAVREFIDMLARESEGCEKV